MTTVVEAISSLSLKVENWGKHHVTLEQLAFDCLPCFKIHLAARPTLSDLSPFQVHRIINSSSNGTLGTGILLNKDTTRLLIEGHNQAWNRQKITCIDHLCLIGDGSRVHQRAVKA